MAEVCEHEFEFGTEKPYETCSGTHNVENCTKCGANYRTVSFARLNDAVQDICIKRIITKESIDYAKPYPHYHVWREDGTCGYKLLYPTDGDGNNHGFERVEVRMHMEIPERRNCTARRT